MPPLIKTVCKPELRNLIDAFTQLPHLAHDQDPDYVNNRYNHHIYDNDYNKWLNLSAANSSSIRAQIYKRPLITQAKLLRVMPEAAYATFKKVQALSSITLRTKILRLVHGDVFCGTRLFKARLTDTDTCIRCFAQETIEHLLLTCPYSKMVWSVMGINHQSIKDILNYTVTDAEFEIRSAVIEQIVFRKGIIPPFRVIETIINRYANGLSKKKKVTDLAKRIKTLHELTGAWHY
jgi:hypothetical protein